MVFLGPSDGGEGQDMLFYAVACYDCVNWPVGIRDSAGWSDLATFKVPTAARKKMTPMGSRGRNF